MEKTHVQEHHNRDQPLQLRTVMRQDRRETRRASRRPGLVTTNLPSPPVRC